MLKHRIYTLSFLIFACGCDFPDQEASIPATPVNGTPPIILTIPEMPTELPASLHDAARDSNILGLDRLWNAGHRLDGLDEAGRTPLHVAIEAQQPKAVQWLLTYKADPYGGKSTAESPLSQAVLIAARCERSSEAQTTAFAIITLLVQHGVNPMTHHNSSSSPLQLAMANDCEACIDHLREITASVAVDTIH